MRSRQPKVLHEVCGRPMLGFVLSACRLAGADRLIVVVGHGREEVQRRFHAERDITWVEQAEQKGTGHAVMCCREGLAEFAGSVLIVAGDMPLVRREMLMDLLDERERLGAALSMATTTLADPSGYGRIARDAAGDIDRIVEDRNCTDEQREIREVNPSYYCFDAHPLFAALELLAPDPARGEFYLTDVVAGLRASGKPVSARINARPEEAMGINSRVDLAAVGRVMQDRLQRALLDGGVTIVDPDNTWIEADVVVGQDTVIYPFTFVGAGATIGEGCRIGPFAWIPRAETVGAGSEVGPIERTRNGALAS
jgi:bifunctional UDP-N-acetylglucosamine pyrophosphorylase/glucosamine-1-phosphate N-acetyltransferase